MTNESSLDTQVECTESAMFLMKHIDAPCVDPTTGQNIRQFYINEAKRLLPKVENPFLKEALETRIAQYSLAGS
jgi:hypothetical protein